MYVTLTSDRPTQFYSQRTLKKKQVKEYNTNSTHDATDNIFVVDL